MNWYSLDKQSELKEFVVEIGDILEIDEGVFIVITSFKDNKINGICILNTKINSLEESIDMLLDSILEAETLEEKIIYKEIVDYLQKKGNVN
jgi:DNA-binding IscR family transcriptional regulator